MSYDLQTTVVVEDKLQYEVENKKKKLVQWCVNNWKAILAEFVATAILLLIACMHTCILPEEIPTSVLYGPIAVGFTVTMNIQAFGHISGAHMNPILSLAALIYGWMSLPLFIMYVIAQCAGAIFGFGILTLLTSGPLAPEGMCTTLPRPDLSTGQALGIEIALSAALNFVLCSVWDSRNSMHMDSISIKFGIVFAGLLLAGGPLTGASMNPARTLAPAIWTGTWQYHWIYWVGPVIGGALSPLMYRYIWKPRSEEHSPEQETMDKRL